MDLIAPVGARTQWEVGGPPPAGAREVRAPDALVAYEPADMTVTVGAGMPFAELDAIVAAHGQMVPLDPRDPHATIGGILACGLSGIRRLGQGPVRDHVLEVRVRTGYGATIKGGGPTVKNVSGYDLPRLLVGSFGTLGLIEQVTLRCRPRPVVSRWFTVADAHAMYRPTARLWTGGDEYVLLEGRTLDDAPSEEMSPPELPSGPHRGRISVASARIKDCARALPRDVRWCAELGVGTIHVACADGALLSAARTIAHAHGGWLLREVGGEPGDDGYGRPLPNLDLMRRIKGAFDPDGRCNPGRLPLEPSGHPGRAT